MVTYLSEHLSRSVKRLDPDLLPVDFHAGPTVKENMVKSFVPHGLVIFGQNSFQSFSVFSDPAKSRGSHSVLGPKHVDEGQGLGQNFDQALVVIQNNILNKPYRKRRRLQFFSSVNIQVSGYYCAFAWSYFGTHHSSDFSYLGPADKSVV